MSDKPKMKKRTKFTILAVFNLTWYTVVVLIANFFDHAVSPELTVGVVCRLDCRTCLALWYQGERETFR